MLRKESDGRIMLDDMPIGQWFWENKLLPIRGFYVLPYCACLAGALAVAKIGDKTKTISAIMSRPSGEKTIMRLSELIEMPLDKLRILECGWMNRTDTRARNPELFDLGREAYIQALEGYHQAFIMDKALHDTQRPPSDYSIRVSAPPPK